jgi:hypothetical protein
MHSTDELTGADFRCSVDGRPAAIEAILPGFAEHDRLGVVVRRPGGALGASALILAAVTAFYDRVRQRATDFFCYPDFYLFHVGDRHGDHGMLDIWPDHKEVVVADDAEALLRAINDRAVTRLLVEDRATAAPRFERQTLASVRIQTALAYAPAGRAAGADVAVGGTIVTERYVSAVLDRSDLAADCRAAIRRDRAALLDAGRPVETYRRLTVDEALARL